MIHRECSDAHCATCAAAWEKETALFRRVRARSTSHVMAAWKAHALARVGYTPRSHAPPVRTMEQHRTAYRAAMWARIARAVRR